PPLSSTLFPYTTLFRSLMEQQGIYYFFEHENSKHTLVLTDSVNKLKAFPSYDKVIFSTVEQGETLDEAVTDWVMEKEVQPGAYADRRSTRLNSSHVSIS